jgi:hypothetical protein
MGKEINLDTIPEEELLQLPICDLPLVIAGTWLQECIETLYRELEEKGLVFRPECYLADEWLTPENEPVIGIPFYLAHPALVRLEKKMMLEAEGETKHWCMKLLRHETGHAITYAYQLNRRRKWQQMFGPSSKEYRDTYRFRPYSKNFVRHLEDYYAQYHPDEDFVETFAVWLTPGLNWQEQYKGWKALKKLKYVDELMQELKGKEPKKKRGTKYWRLASLRLTLKNYYKRKRHFWAEDFPDFHDSNLKRIFAEETEETKTRPPAAHIIKSYRKNILNSISRWTGERKYIVNDLLKRLAERCQALKLVAPDSEPEAVLRISTYITTLVMNYRYTGRFRGEKRQK